MIDSCTGAFSQVNDGEAKCAGLNMGKLLKSITKITIVCFCYLTVNSSRSERNVLSLVFDVWSTNAIDKS